MNCVESEKFYEVLEGLKEIVQGIDNRKTALVQVMVDPQSRKGGSSLFTEILERTTSCFHLTELYKNLRNKLDRLDMLGIHIGEALHECSQLRVAEGTRSTQLTLEFLEAFIVGFYSAEVTHYIGLQFGEGHLPFPLSEWWVFYAMGAGAFLTTLPWLTMVRESFSHFKVKEPRWFSIILKFGSVIGPALLSAIIYLTIMEHWDQNWIFPRGVFLLALFAAFAMLSAGWWIIHGRLIRSRALKRVLFSKLN